MQILVVAEFYGVVNLDGHSEKLEAVETQRDKVSAAWVFRGTRVPIVALFENLRDGATVDQFLEWFPGVKRKDVECLGSLWLPPKADQRLQKLMDCNSEGLLTDAECAELKSLVELSERLSLFRAEAIHLLGGNLNDVLKRITTQLA